MKSRNLFSKKLEHFYCDIQQKREQIAENAKIRLQPDLEFVQNKIKKINRKYNDEMFSLASGGKAYAAEKKIREF